MIFYEHYVDNLAAGRQARTAAARVAAEHDEDSGDEDDEDEAALYCAEHMLLSLNNHSYFYSRRGISKKSASSTKRACRHCGKSTTYYCDKCTTKVNGPGRDQYNFYTRCQPFKGDRGKHNYCYFKHLRNPLAK